MKNIKTRMIVTSLALIMSASLFANTQSSVLTTDTAITAAIMSKLASDPVTASSPITVQTVNKEVTLMGTVKTDTEVDEAVQQAESVSGVKDVESKLVVPNSPQPLTDTVITAKIKGLYIKEKVFGDKPISVTGVKVETQNGVVTLSGNVDNIKQKHEAIKLAKSVKGVTKVESKLQLASR